jgi:hypothetical protein
MKDKFRTDCFIFHNNNNMYGNIIVRRMHIWYNRHFIENLKACMENVIQK